MNNTIAQYNENGQPIPGVMLSVQSPFAGALLLARIITDGEHHPSWRQVWSMFWDSLPRAKKMFMPRVALPIIYPSALNRLPNRRRSQIDQNTVVDRIIDSQVREDLEGERDIRGDGRRVLQLIQSYIRASQSANGIQSWAFSGFGMESAAPTITYDATGRIHNEHQAAIVYPDGWQIYVWHGSRVPQNVILAPHTITIAQIESETNAEVRRILIDRFGQIRYFEESGAVEVSRDKFGVLLRKEIPGDEAMSMIRVVNSTPEPDGSFKTYHLRVPPTARTPREAVAWSFGMDADEYDPKIES